MGARDGGGRKGRATRRCCVAFFAWRCFAFGGGRVSLVSLESESQPRASLTQRSGCRLDSMRSFVSSLARIIFPTLDFPGLGRFCQGCRNRRRSVFSWKLCGEAAKSCPLCHRHLDAWQHRTSLQASHAKGVSFANKARRFGVRINLRTIGSQQRQVQQGQASTSTAIRFR